MVQKLVLWLFELQALCHRIEFLVECITLEFEHEAKLFLKSVIWIYPYVWHHCVKFGIVGEVIFVPILLLQRNEVVFFWPIVMVLMLSLHFQGESITLLWQLEVRSQIHKLLRSCISLQAAVAAATLRLVIKRTIA